MLDREDRGDRLERPGAAEQVAGHRLGAGHHDVVRVGSERGVDHQPLGDVALRGRGGVRVDVHDVLRVQLGLLQRPQDGPRAAAAGRVGLGDVVSVGGDAGAEHLGVDPGATGLGVLLGLEDQHARTLAEHEAVAGGVPGPGDSRRVTGVLGQRHHVGERRHRQRVDGGLGAAGQDDVGPAEPDLVECEGDALVAGGTGGHRGVGRGAGAEHQAHVGGRGVRHQHRDGQRGDAARPLVAQRRRSCRAAW